MSAPKIIAQIAIAGGSILIKAFAAAYQQAAKNAAQGAQQRAVGGAATSANSLTRRTGITVEEARQILNVNQQTTAEEVLQKYNHLFQANDPSKGGSVYLQGKVYRAKERIDLEMKLETNEGKPVAGPSTSSTSSSSSSS